MTSPDPLGVQIGAREIYDKVTEVGSKVDRLTDQHEVLRSELLDFRTTVAEFRADHEKRLRALERNRWPLPSLAALLALASLAVAVLGLITKGG
jgi:predicted  nucleic acid-binding Zn-ribbon protein